MYVPDKPTVVTLCGSTRYRQAFERAMKELTLQGKIVLTVGMFGHEEGIDMEGEVKKMLDELHLRKIDMSNEVYILNVGGRIGESTGRELEYARKNCKKIIFLEPENSLNEIR